MANALLTPAMKRDVKALCMYLADEEVDYKDFIADGGDPKKHIYHVVKRLYKKVSN